MTMKNVIRNQYLSAKFSMQKMDKYEEMMEKNDKFIIKQYLKFLRILLPILGVMPDVSGMIYIPEEMYSHKRVKKVFNEYEKQLLDLDLISLDDVLTDEQKSAYYGYDGLPL